MSAAADSRTLVLLASAIAVAITVAVVTWRAGQAGENAANTRLARAGTLLSAATWVLLVFGSSVRVNGAGLACPDWPACFGDVVPALDWEVFLEFGHRAYAGLISLGFLALGTMVAFRPDLRRRMLPLFGLAAVALATQIVLGGLTVLHLLAEWTVAGHLVCGNLFSGMLCLIALSLRDVAWPQPRVAVTAGSRVLAGGFAVALLTQLALGGLVASSHAGLACASWPGCNGADPFPTFAGLVGLQVMHRLVAYSLLLIAGGAAAITLGRGRAGKASALVLGLVVAQATLGIANVFLHLPVEITLAHSAGAGGLVLSTVWFNFEAWRSPLASPAGQPALSAVEAR